MTRISDLSTPAAVVDVARLQHNLARMQSRMDSLGARLRPHVKTTKCPTIVAAQLAAGARGITVSTLKEAEEFFASGITDIVYAVGMVPAKLPQALSLRRRGCDLKLITDNAVAARAIADFGRAHGEQFEVWIELDVDGHRSGVTPDGENLLGVAGSLVDGDAHLGGVLAHAGSSYDVDTESALLRIAEQERAGAVHAARRLREAGHDCETVSIGSTPTALTAARLDGVAEVRAGVYAFFDLVMQNLGVCHVEEIALSVLTTVIGHQEQKGWAIVDAGWMAMSRDRGTASRKQDFGFGQACDEDGRVLTGYILSSANQEHGVLSRLGEPDLAIASRFPLGTRLRVLPNHACATAAQHPAYQALTPGGEVETWPRFYGW